MPTRIPIRTKEGYKVVRDAIEAGQTSTTLLGRIPGEEVVRVGLETWEIITNHSMYADEMKAFGLDFLLKHQGKPTFPADDWEDGMRELLGRYGVNKSTDYVLGQFLYLYDHPFNHQETVRAKLLELIEDSRKCQSLGSSLAAKSATSSLAVAVSPQENIAPKKNRWEDWEHLEFLKGLRVHGQGRWKQISETIPTRTHDQVKIHAQGFMKKLDRGVNIFEPLDNHNSVSNYIKHNNNKNTQRNESESSSASISALLVKIASLEKENAEQQNELDSLQTMVEYLDKTNKRLEEENETLKEEKQSLEDTQKDNKVTIARLQKEHKAKIYRLEDKYHENQSKIDSLEKDTKAKIVHVEKENEYLRLQLQLLGGRPALKKRKKGNLDDQPSSQEMEVFEISV